MAWWLSSAGGGYKREVRKGGEMEMRGNIPPKWLYERDTPDSPACLPRAWMRRKTHFCYLVWVSTVQRKWYS